MKRILFKENGIATQSVPNGYKAMGLKSGDLVLDDQNSIIEKFNTPQNLIYMPGLIPDEDLGNGIVIRQNRSQNIDLDLSAGNYSNIIFEDYQFKSLTLPKKWGSNLTTAQLLVSTLDTNPTQITLADYPNLTMIKGHGICRNGTKPYNFEITDEVIDLPNLRSLGFLGSKQCLPVKTGPSIKIMARSNNTICLGSNDLKSFEIDFSSFTHSNLYSDGTKEFSFATKLFSQNVTSITFSNMGVYDNRVGGSMIFDFDSTPLTTESIDNILLSIDNAFPDTIGSPGSISITQDDVVISGPSLIIGESYVIDSLNGSDDFTNVGFVSTGTTFSATGTTPTDWSNSTNVYALSYGNVAEAEFYFNNQVPVDGTYSDGTIHLVVLGGTISHAELVTPNGGYNITPGPVNYEELYDGGAFKLYDEYRRIIWQGISGTHDLIIKYTRVTRTGSPTDGQSNVNKLSLESKGWTVNVNSY